MNSTLSDKLCPDCGKKYTEGDTCPDDGARLVEDPADPFLGQVLKDAYLIEERIAAGGMGVVYRATQIALGRTVALKTILPDLVGTVNLQRFNREAKLLSQINHPNVVTLLDFGNTKNGVLFMVLEYLKGCTLDKVVPADQGMPLDLVLDIMQQTCDGLAAAHHLNIVHRDLKPTNVFLAQVGAQSTLVKLLDFGIAKLVDDQEVQLTQKGVMMGSCGYMSPEQISGSVEIDARADIYSLGGLLYFLVAGKPAFRGRNTRSILMKQMLKQPMPFDSDRLGEPTGRKLMAVILKAMDSEPAQRHASVGEFMADVRRALGDTTVPTDSDHRQRLLTGQATTEGPQPETSSGFQETNQTSIKLPPSVPEPPIAPAPPTGRTGRKALVAALGFAFLASAAAGVFLLGGQSKPRVTTTAQGVSDGEILLGMSSVFSGPAKELGRGVKLGVDLAIHDVNDRGGIDGRKLRLVALDDGYEPVRALANMKELNEHHRVFAVIGNVGTPTAAVAVPYALENKLIFFGAFTGSNLLRRDPPDRYVFNYRASYAEETEAMVNYFVAVKKFKPEQIAVFAQQDAYGDSGYQGAVKAIRGHGGDADKVLRVGYPRNTVEIDDAVKEIVARKDDIKAIIMVPTYRPAAQFVHRCKNSGVGALFACVSFVGSEALQEEFRQMGGTQGEGVIVTQVVPPIASYSKAVVQYHDLLKEHYPGEQPSFASLEGFIAGKLLVEGLRKAGPNLTTESLIGALESIKDLDLGLGAPLSFGPSRHQGSHKVWGTVLDGSLKYQTLELD